MTPACSRCGFEIDRCEFVYSSQHMLQVQQTMPRRSTDPLGARVPTGAPFWVCASCQQSFEEVLEVVKTGAAERERLARPSLVPQFWPRDLLSFDDLKS